MKVRVLARLALVSLFGATSLAGAVEPDIGIELNKLEPQAEDCRAYLVLENGTGSAFESLKLDLVMFDPTGVVAKRLAVETAPLPAGKTRLKVFDIAALRCEEIGRVLLNDVLDCADASGARSDCLERITARGRGEIDFIK